MKILHIGPMMAVLAAAAVHVPAAAADGTIPAGSYQQSCRNISVSGTTLSATCLDSHGNPKGSLLPQYDAYPGQDIANCNGVLTIGSCPTRR